MSGTTVRAAATGMALAALAFTLTGCGRGPGDTPAAPPVTAKPGCIAVAPEVATYISSKLTAGTTLGTPFAYEAPELDMIWMVVSALDGPAGGAAAVWAIGADPSTADATDADIVSVDNTAQEFSTWPTDSAAVPPKSPSINASIRCL